MLLDFRCFFFMPLDCRVMRYSCHHRARWRASAIDCCFTCFDFAAIAAERFHFHFGRCFDTLLQLILIQLTPITTPPSPAITPSLLPRLRRCQPLPSADYYCSPLPPRHQHACSLVTTLLSRPLIRRWSLLYLPSILRAPCYVVADAAMLRYVYYYDSQMITPCLLLIAAAAMRYAYDMQI